LLAALPTRAQGASFFTALDSLARNAATAITLLIHAGQGDTARSTRLVCTAMVAFVAAVAHLNPIASTQALDSTVMDTAAQIQQGFLEQLHLGDRTLC
jgi:hypothetical protein